MNSRHLVDPELLPFLDAYQPLEISREDLVTVRERRASVIHAMLRELPPDTIEKTEHFVPGIDGAPAVRILVYRPRQARLPAPVYLNIHGGGMIVGLPEQDEAANRRIAAELGCIVVSPAYRLAPETMFPGPLDDCCATLHWIVENAVVLGIDKERIAVGGVSAGGGLATALALKVRDQGKIRLMLLLLVFPMLDDRTGSARESSAYAGEFIWTAAQNRFGWTAYLGKPAGGELCERYSVPARADDLAGLPPTFIACGALDLFIDENLEFARRLIQAGVPAELHVYPGAYHAFTYAPVSEVTQAFQRDRLLSLRRALK
jgi:acetyl esterase/lipase